MLVIKGPVWYQYEVQVAVLASLDAPAALWPLRQRLRARMRRLN